MTAKVFVTVCAVGASTCTKAAVTAVEVAVLSGTRRLGSATTDEAGVASLTLPDDVSGAARVQAVSPVLSRTLDVAVSVPDDGSVSVELVDPVPLRRVS